MSLLILMLLCPLLVCGGNAILNRRPGAKPHSTPFTAGKVANLTVIPLYLGLHLRALAVDPVEFVAGAVALLIFLNCVVFLNWFIFTLTDVSMHIQLMMQLHKAGSLATDELTARYNKDRILGNRIPRLLELGQLRIENGRLFACGRSVLFGASVCTLLRLLLGIPLRPQDADHTQ